MARRNPGRTVATENNALAFLCDVCALWGEPIWLWLAGRAATLPALERA